MVFRNGICGPQHDQHLAVDDRSGSRVPNDAREGVEVRYLGLVYFEILTLDTFCSGNVTIETSFYDGEALVSKSVVRLYYV